MKYLIRIRWNCGTERYVTGYGDGRSVKWDPDKPAMVLSAETALDISTGLNFNHMSGELGGFSHVEVIKDDWDIPVNPSEDEEHYLEGYRFMKLKEVLDGYKQEAQDES